MNYPFDKIRAAYVKHNPWLIAISKADPRRWYRPYIMDWMAFMSPIEKQMWEAIRYFGHVPLYPQYPIGKYFVDFANPILKIIIECDGKAYHQDKEKERIREAAIMAEGWTIYRVTGSECKRIPELEPDTEEDSDYDADSLYIPEILMRWLKNYYLRSIEGLLLAIAVVHLRFMDGYIDSKRKEVEKELANEVLKKRKVVHQ